MGSQATTLSAVEPQKHFEHHDHIRTDPIEITSGLGHQRPPTNPENPQNWPTYQKIFVSAVSTALAFTVYDLFSPLYHRKTNFNGGAFGLTTYTVGVPKIMPRVNVSTTLVILPISINFVGISFAPIYTPHPSERYGRRPVYVDGTAVFGVALWGEFEAEESPE